MSHHTETLVIGAGPAGLTAGYLLSKEGRDVTVLERDPSQVGGISRTVSHHGYLFDIGGHRFFSKSKAVVDLWDEILPNDFIDRPRLSRIYYKGKYYAYPLKAFEALRNLGLLQSAACVGSYLRARARPVREPKTFHEWVRNQFGERLFAIFFKTYTEKVWGMSCDAISADWAAQRIKGLDLGAAIRDAVVRSLGLRKKKPAAGEPVIKTLIESFRYPRRGPGMMWEAAAERIAAQGGKVLLDRGVDGLRYDARTGLWTVTALRGDGARETFTARHVISSAPLRELVDALRPTPLSTFNARALAYRDFLTVALIAKAREDFPDNWIYIHDPAVQVGRVQNFRSWSPEMVPDERFTCLGLEYFCFEGDGLWNASDAELIALAKREIGQIGLIAPEDVVDACVVRQPKAYPVYDEDYKAHVATIRRDLESAFPSLHLVGRNGMHKYNNQDHAMMTAMLTVKNILAGERLYDTWCVNEDAEYAEAGVSGAQEALASERLVPRRAA
ncbi:NAD(P)/FAD-dependent oxidoreductase [Methylobacterium organophilum]|uniref:NAD(P)/FAD-dependent oxidoreductase n=1 Tax=Methylobacterium organophilum TaxID=410 RepID=UPI001F12B6FA|nr:NAD(P)/FAD-dependent oxidoreductase [Methylobacterium organophilum]UMY16048.1 NAD(P)/FAD-dependent oxidoreductase [Methylobacterium organophilum]